MSTKMRRKAMSATTKITTSPSMTTRRKMTSLKLRLRHLKTSSMTLMAMTIWQIRMRATKKLMTNKMLSNLKRTPKKIPESQAITLCQLKIRAVVLDKIKISVATKRQRIVVVDVVVEEKVLKWSIGQKSKLQRKRTPMARTPRETSKKSVQRSKKRMPRLRLMQL